MGLSSILINAVGRGIAKGVLNLWLEEELFPTKIGENLIDILSKKTDDDFAIAEGKIQFEQAANNVAKYLITLFNRTNKSITLKEKEAVATSAGRVLNETPISFTDLLENGLDPNYLFQLFLRGPKDWVDPLTTKDHKEEFIFNEEQAYLYKRILKEAANQIIDISAQLPSLQGKIFAEVLTRKSSIIKIVDEILDRVRRINSSLESKENLSLEFENDYRKAITRNLDELELFGVDLSDSSKRYRLSIAYVTLSVEFKNKRDKAGIENSNLLPLDKVLGNTNRLFIRGSAGSGKTTLMKWIAVMSASKNLKGSIEAWNELVPFFIKLREYSNKDFPNPEGFPNHNSKILEGDMPPKWVREILKNGKGIVLVDGLDELTEDKRTKLKKWLRDLVELFPNSKYVITSRPYASEKDWFEKNKFLVADLQDMNSEDVYEFIDHWHASVLDGIVEEKKKNELLNLKTRLKSEIKKSRNIRKLVINPLLCAMICALNRDREAELPSDRIDLYRACIDMFLRRDKERKVALEDYVKIGDRQKRVLLEDLAYWLIRNNWSEVEVEKVIKKFQLKFNSLENVNKEITGEDIKKYFVERSGILRQPSVGKIDFPHRTFEEFLAARAAVEESDFGVLVDNAEKVQWREVIILACGLGNKKDREQLILNIIKKGDHVKTGKAQLHLLAAACSEVIIELSSKTKEEIQSRLVKLLPPKSMENAKELATAGELVVPYLKYDKKLPIKNLASIVRTLCLIGGEESFSELENFIKDKRKTLRDEIQNGVKYIDSPGEYAKRIFCKMNLKYIYIYETYPLEALKKLEMAKSIEKVQLASYEDQSHYAFLMSLSNLKELEILDIKQLDANKLISLTNLTDIKLNVEKLYNLSFLNSNNNLKSLGIYSFKNQFINLSSLKKLTSLTLDLSNAEGISFVKNIENLFKLHLIGTSLDIYNFVHLKELNKLTELILEQFKTKEVNFKIIGLLRNLLILRIKKLNYLSLPLSWI